MRKLTRMRLEMMRFHTACRIAAALFPLVACAVPARGEPAAPSSTPSSPPPVDVEFTLAAVSDYRYRGLSLSNKKPSLQAELTATHDTGLYAALWAATIADNGGADLENQVTVGYAGEAGGIAFDLAAAYYLYPGASGDNYAEFAARVSRAVGPAEVGATLSYAPAQANIGDVDNLYAGLDASLALGPTPLTLSGNIGVEDGAFGDHKLDWSLGVSGDAVGLTFGVAYVDSSRTSRDPQGKPTIVGSISKSF
jgi:uncharacterized protein (TIGR02001 family)